MIKLTFQIGGEYVEYRIEKKSIFIRGKSTNYSWIDWNPLGLNNRDLTKLRRKNGETWFKSYKSAMNKFKQMETEEEIAQDLIKDLKKDGWILTRKE